MTGADVSKLREGLEWSAAQFATLLGVSPSTVYRWEEHAEERLKIEPLQLQLLVVLRTELQRGRRTARELRDRLEGALALGGSLRALHVLLSAIYPDDKAHPEAADRPS